VARAYEIERKYLVSRPPPGWRKRRSVQILQGYFPLRNRKTEIRIRKIGRQHFVTIKAGDGRKRLEEEIKISARTFDALWPLTAGAQISKRRYLIASGGRTLELDKYEGRHAGLMTVEVEFDSVRASESFQPPPWFGREVTGRRKYSNAALSRSAGETKKNG
jgi:adenylate cyclase